MPIIQTVFETLRDIKDDKGSKSKSGVTVEAATRSTEGNTSALCCVIVTFSTLSQTLTPAETWSDCLEQGQFNTAKRTLGMFLFMAGCHGRLK